MADFATLLFETADELQMPVEDLATILSYETGGTLDPLQKGVITKWGQHEGLLQFGEPQAEQYGADFSSPEVALTSQLGREGAVANYFRDRGWKPGMRFIDAYSIVNAGGPGLYHRSDEAAGGMPGTVADKVMSEEMRQHRANAVRRLGLGDVPLSFPEQTEASLTSTPEAEEAADPDAWMYEPTGFEDVSEELQEMGLAIMMGEY